MCVDVAVVTVDIGSCAVYSVATEFQEFEWRCRNAMISSLKEEKHTNQNIRHIQSRNTNSYPMRAGMQCLMRLMKIIDFYKGDVKSSIGCKT